MASAIRSSRHKVTVNHDSRQRKILRPFRYDRAILNDQIRLLYIEDSSNGPVSVQLRTLSKRGAKYHALSYTWGVPVFSEKIQCNGRELRITKSLHDLLSALRDDYAGQWIWIDAICINQADSYDKNFQVARMSYIYRQATSVIVWLGKANPTTATGLRLLENLCRAFPSANGSDIRSLWLEDTTNVDFLEMDRSGTLAQIGIPTTDMTCEEWQAAGSILDSAWFTRRWILQEVANSRTCVFRIGSYETSPEIVLGGIYRIASFSEFRHALNAIQRSHCNCVEKIVQLMRYKQTDWYHESMADILLDTTPFRSSDPRDRIFAITGCLRSFPDTIIDYNKSLPDILLDIAFSEHEEEEFKLSLLRGMCYVDRTHGEVPSWVPTWNFDIMRSLWNECEDDCVDVEQMEISISKDRKTLTTRAIIFDQVHQISEPLKFQDALPFARDDQDTQETLIAERYTEKLNWLRDATQIAEEAFKRSSFCQNSLEAFLHCYLFGSLGRQDKHIDIVPVYENFVRLGSIMSARLRQSDAVVMSASYKARCDELRVPYEIPGMAIDACTIAEKYCCKLSAIAAEDNWHNLEDDTIFGRCFFGSMEGRIGWTPQTALPGDKLCVVFGFATPFAIRKVKSGINSQPDEYRLIGACYVHNSMDGEIFMNNELPRVKLKLV